MKQSNRGELGRRDNERPRGRRDDEQPGGGREGPRREKPGQEKAGLIPLKARYLKAQGASLQAPRGSTMEPVALGFRPTGTSPAKGSGCRRTRQGERANVSEEWSAGTRS